MYADSAHEVGGGAPRKPSQIVLVRPASSPIVRRRVVVPAAIHAPPATLGWGAREDEFNGLGFSLGKTLKNIGKASVKAVKDTGHAAGAVVTSKVSQALIGTGLALTGVGMPAAIAIGAGAQAGGRLIKKGGNLREFGKGAVIGGTEGAAAGLAGKVLKNNAPGFVDANRKRLGMGSFRPPKVPAAAARALPNLALRKVPDLIHSSTPPSIAVAALPAAVAAASTLTPPPSAPEDTTAADAVKLATTPDAKAKAAKNKQQGSNVFKRLRDLAVEKAGAAVTGPVFDPGTGPMAAPSSPAGGDAAPQQAGMLGGVSPVVLLGGGALVLLMVSMNKGGNNSNGYGRRR